jgi:hypothetical protein
MVLDGPVRLYRWRGAVRQRRHTAVRRAELPRVSDLPFGAGEDEGADHAEGVTLLPDEDALLVVYDSPAPARVLADGVLADVVRLRVPAPRAPAVPDAGPTGEGLTSDASPTAARSSLQPTEVP